MNPRRRNLRPHQKYGLHKFASIAELLSVPLGNGVSSFLVNNRWFDVMYVDRGAAVTMVTFHAALSPNTEDYPVFSGGRFSEEIDANHLAFADSACGSAESLLTFWHMSTRRVDAQSFIPQIVRHASVSSNPKELIFFGSSAGGFAALYYSSLFPGSIAFVMNPRIDLKGLPSRFESYAAVAYPGSDVDAVSRKVPTSMAEHYAKPRPNTVAYLQNAQDQIYFEHHFTPFAESTSGSAHIFTKVREWGEGHVVPPKTEYLEPLRALCKVAPDWPAVLKGDFLQRGTRKH